MRTCLKLAVFGCVLAAMPAMAETPKTDAPWIVSADSVRAHETYLASDALRGRGSATPDEARAAAYVAEKFAAYGLKPAPGMTGYLQTATIVRPRLEGPVSLTIGDTTLTAGLTLLTSSGKPVSGTIQLVSDPNSLPLSWDGALVKPESKLGAQAWMRIASQRGYKLLILRESEETKSIEGVLGGRTKMTDYLEGDVPKARPNVVVLKPDLFDKVAASQGASFSFTLPPVIEDKAVTTNAIGFLAGSDLSAGTLLYSAHLDHLGVRPDGTIMPGANDDASGTTAVLELAQALAAGKPPRRSILFVAYGSEELGGFGSKHFAKHPPVPLSSLVANIEFEMIGAQDPKMPAGVMMMTGFERSDLGDALKAHGAQVAPDLYPDQHFFERSDNYSLALQGIVAHTISGWAVTPTYHSPTDDVAHLDIAFMTSAIQSLIAPARWLADSDFTPQWKPGGKPVAK